MSADPIQAQLRAALAASKPTPVAKAVTAAIATPPVIPTAPTTMSPPAAAKSSGDFVRIMKKAQDAGLWDKKSHAIDAAMLAVGIKNLADLDNRPDLLALFELQIDALIGPAKAQAAERHKIFAYEQFMKMKTAADWIIEDVMPSQGVGVVYAPSRMGKSFLVIDILGAIAKGWSCSKNPNGKGHYFQHRILGRRKVLYIPLEGGGGVQRRLAAYAKQYGAPEGLSIMPTTFNLCDPAEVDLLLAQIDASEWRGAVIAIDTVAQAMAGGDENSPEGMGKLILALQRIQHHTGGFVIGVHHEGKTESQGMRGHSSFEATADLTIWVGTQQPVESKDLNHTQPREWRVTKLKDGETGQRHGFVFEVVPLDEVNDEGKPRTSLVVVPENAATKIAAAALGGKLRENEAEQTVLAAFDALKKMGIDPAHAKNSPDYLPTQALNTDCAKGFNKKELGAALGRLMKAGRFKRDKVGTYSNGTVRYGLVKVSP